MATRTLRIIVVCSILAVVGATGARALELEQMLEEFDRVQESIRTLSAEFTETMHSTLLKDKIVARGQLFLTKPDSVRWEYSAPEEMRFVIADDQYTGYFPLRKQAERRDVRRWGDHLFRFLGVGQASDELGKFYRIRIGEADGRTEGTVLLELDPKKKRVRKRMESVQLWIDANTYLPVRVRYTSNNGDTRDIEFERMQINPELAASLYDVHLPEDVQVTQGFSALSGFGTSSAR